MAGAGSGKVTSREAGRVRPTAAGSFALVGWALIASTGSGRLSPLRLHSVGFHPFGLAACRRGRTAAARPGGTASSRTSCGQHVLARVAGARASSQVTVALFECRRRLRDNELWTSSPTCNGTERGRRRLPRTRRVGQRGGASDRPGHIPALEPAASQPRWLDPLARPAGSTALPLDCRLNPAAYGGHVSRSLECAHWSWGAPVSGLPASTQRSDRRGEWGRRL